MNSFIEMASYQMHLKVSHLTLILVNLSSEILPPGLKVYPHGIKTDDTDR